MGLYKRLRRSLTTDIKAGTEIQATAPTYKNAPIASQANPESAQKLEVSQSHPSPMLPPMYLDNNPAPTKATDIYNVILICNQYIPVAPPKPHFLPFPYPHPSILPQKQAHTEVEPSGQELIGY